ncbi:MAG: hypothetical protein WC332_00600 [Clostridia bacterium]
MMNFYVPKNLEKYVKWHIPFTPYYLYRYDKVWRVVEKEIRQSSFFDEDRRSYHYRFL